MCVNIHCVKLHSVCKITYFRICVNDTLFCKTTHCVQYQSSFFHVSIGKFYTWLIFFTQPAVVMVVTNMKYATDRLIELECRATSVAKNIGNFPFSLPGLKYSAWQVCWNCKTIKDTETLCNILKDSKQMMKKTIKCSRRMKKNELFLKT